MSTATLGFEIRSQTALDAKANLEKMTGAAALAQKAASDLNAISLRASGGGRSMAQAAQMVATAQTRVAAATKGTTAALQEQAAAARLASMSMRNVQFQVVDIVQGIPLLFQSTTFGLLNLANQGAQLSQIYGPNEGGAARAFKEAGLMLGRLALRFAPVIGLVGVGAAAWALFTSKTSEASAEMRRLANEASSLDSVSAQIGDLESITDAYARAIRDTAKDQRITSNSIIADSKREFEAKKSLLGLELKRQEALIEIGRLNVKNAQNDLRKQMEASVSTMIRGETERGLRYPEVGLVAKPYDPGLQAMMDTANGPAGETLKRLRAELTLSEVALNKLKEALGTTFEDSVAKSQSRLSKTGKTDAEKMAEKYADLVRGANQFIETQDQERGSMFLTAEAAARLRYEQELLHRAANDNLALSPAQREELKKLAGQMAEAEAATNHLREAFDFAKDTAKGFMSDLRSGLEQGKGIWKSFADAALGALDKIVDKLLNDVVDAIFQVNNAGSSGGGGFWSALGSVVGSVFGGGGGFKDGGINAMLGIGSNASGTSNWRGGPTWVGERGPEIVNLPRGAQVIPNHIAANSNARPAANQNGGVIEVRVTGVFVDDNGVIKARIDQGMTTAAAAGAQGGANLAMTQLARGEADSTMSALYGVQRQTKVIG